MKPAVILFSHGSLLCGAGQQLEAHAERLRMTREYSRVEIGYLNYSSPTFADAVQECVAASANKIFIAPYFLVPGYFVKVALPKVLQPERARFPDVEFQVAPALGDHELLAQALLNCARRSASSENWRAILHSAPQFCEQSSDCPLFEKCRAQNFQIRNPVTSQSESSSFLAPCSSLLFMVHGSPKPESNADMFRVVQRVRAGGEYSQVEVGFMECNEPGIPDAIENLVNGGAKSIIAVPYFLHAGTHVADDLPTLLEDAARKFGDVEFLLGDYLGRDPLVTQVLQERVNEISA
jgi:sirohydrochlorin cobaltochelatase